MTGAHPRAPGSMTEESLHIEPVAPPLSGRGRDSRWHRRRGRRRSTLRVWAFTGALTILAGALVFVAAYLPERIDRPQLPAGIGTANPAITSPGRSQGEIVPPFEAAELAQARQEAEAQLAEFIALELRLEEELNVDAWGESELAAIKDRANDADDLFVAGQFHEALTEYAGATDELKALFANGEERFSTAIGEGEAAIIALDHPAAVAAFERASTIRVDDPRVAAGSARTARLPEIIELLRESDRAVLRRNYPLAEEFLAKVKTIDPATTGLDERFAAIAADIADELRRTTLSEGFAALENGDHDIAIDAFERVLARTPRDADGLAGLQQAKQARILAQIDRLRDAAERAEQQAKWASALAAYNEALAIDPTLKFAIAGKQRIAGRVVLMQAMARFNDDPAVLSGDNEFADAREVLARAEAEIDPGEKFAAEVAKLRAIIEHSTAPVPLILVSDNTTEVVIHNVGALGAFTRNEILLRPGRYVIVGSRDGCRDVRKEIILAPGMEPVDIRCVESI